MWLALTLALRPDFALVELSRAHWRNPLLRRLLIMGYLVWPLVIGISDLAWLYGYQVSQWISLWHSDVALRRGVRRGGRRGVQRASVWRGGVAGVRRGGVRRGW